MEPWKIISDEEVEAIHQSTLRVLNEVGILLDHPEIAAMLVDLGAKKQGKRVRLPADLVEGSLERCTKQVEIKGRNGDTVVLGDGSLHWHNLGGARQVYQPEDGQVRNATVQDVVNATRVLDALDQATTVTPFFTPTDVPGELMSLAMYRHCLSHTTKPVQGPGIQTARETQYAIDLAKVIGPAREFLTLSVSPISPLTFPANLAESMVEIARQGIGFGPLPCPTAGTTAPMSLAGALTQQNAEVLASIVIAQSVCPGLPIIYCGRLAMMEPRTATSVWGGVELGIASAATVQIGHRYGLPVNVYGFSTNAHILDIQSGYERALNAILPALAGADELSGIGEMSAGVMGSLAQMVCDNDIAAAVQRCRRGFTVDEEALAVEVIRDVMDGPRNFMTEMHTVKFLRAGEILTETLGVRQTYEQWLKDGGEDFRSKAHSQAKMILATHQVPELSSVQETEMDRIMKAAENEFLP